MQLNLKAQNTGFKFRYFLHKHFFDNFQKDAAHNLHAVPPGPTKFYNSRLGGQGSQSGTSSRMLTYIKNDKSPEKTGF